MPSLRAEGWLLPEVLLESAVEVPDPGKQREHDDDVSQALHARGIGSSSAPVQPPQERLEFLGLDRGVAVRRGLPVRPVADQLLVRTGEMTRAQGVRTPLGNFGAVARYLPALSGMRIS
jgi:hypothetical protein